MTTGQLEFPLQTSLQVEQLPGEIPPEVSALFERLALEVMARGFKRYSSDAVLHRVRWHYHIEKGNREFKCNNNWTAPLARWFLRNHPEAERFFETRKSPQ